MGVGCLAKRQAVWNPGPTLAHYLLQKRPDGQSEWDDHDAFDSPVPLRVVGDPRATTQHSLQPATKEFVGIVLSHAHGPGHRTT